MWRKLKWWKSKTLSYFCDERNSEISSSVDGDKRKCVKLLTMQSIFTKQTKVFLSALVFFYHYFAVYFGANIAHFTRCRRSSRRSNVRQENYCFECFGSLSRAHYFLCAVCFSVIDKRRVFDSLFVIVQVVFHQFFCSMKICVDFLMTTVEMLYSKWSPSIQTRNSFILWRRWRWFLF